MAQPLYDSQRELTPGIWAGSIKLFGPVTLNYSFVLQREDTFQSPALFPTADHFVTLFDTVVTLLNPKGIKVRAH